MRSAALRRRIRKITPRPFLAGKRVFRRAPLAVKTKRPLVKTERFPDYPVKFSEKWLEHPSMRKIIAKAVYPQEESFRLQGKQIDDVINEVLFLVTERWHNYNPTKGRFQTWVFRLAADYSKDIARSAWTRKSRIARGPLDQSERGSYRGKVGIETAARVENNETRRIISQLLNELPAEDQKILVLHVIDGLSKPSAARKLGLSTEQFKYRFDRALSNARAWLDSNPQWKKLVKEDPNLRAA